MSRLPTLALILALAASAVLSTLPEAQADVARLLRQVDRGSVGERTAALKDLVLEDSAAAVAKAVSWLEPGQDPALRRAGARALWDFSVVARPAEPALRARLDDPDIEVAYNAVGALAALKVPKADLRPARLRIARSGDPFLAFYAVRALTPDPELPLTVVIQASVEALNLVALGRPSDSNSRSSLRTNARESMFALAKSSGRPGFDALLAAYPQVPPHAKEVIADALDHVPPADGDPTQIAVLLDSPQLAVRRSAVYALADYGARALPVIDPLLAGLAPQREPALRKTTASALGRLAEAPSESSKQALSSPWRSEVETRIAPALAQSATRDPDKEVRKEAAEALQKLRLWAGPALGGIGDRIPLEPDPGVRHALVRACWSARESPKLPRTVLVSLAESDPDQYVRNEAKSVLERR